MRSERSGKATTLWLHNPRRLFIFKIIVFSSSLQCLRWHHSRAFIRLCSAPSATTKTTYFIHTVVPHKTCEQTRVYDVGVVALQEARNRNLNNLLHKHWEKFVFNSFLPLDTLWAAEKQRMVNEYRFGFWSIYPIKITSTYFTSTYCIIAYKTLVLPLLFSLNVLQGVLQ